MRRRETNQALQLKYFNRASRSGKVMLLIPSGYPTCCSSRVMFMDLEAILLLACIHLLIFTSKRCRQNVVNYNAIYIYIYNYDNLDITATFRFDI